MRHGDKVNNLGRKVGHRKALLKNLAISLIKNKSISTTLTKAKVLRGFVEPLVTKSKDNTTHSRRMAFSYLQDKRAVKELFDVIGPKVLDRPGGYVRIIKTGTRLGDGAETAMIELVDFNEHFLASKADSSKKKRTRRGRGKSKSYNVAAPATPVVDEVVETIADEVSETTEGDAEKE